MEAEDLNTPFKTPYKTPSKSKTSGDSKKKKQEEKQKQDCLPETPPAWLIPKSPLDSVFRTRFGGLGDPELSQVALTTVGGRVDIGQW